MTKSFCSIICCWSSFLDLANAMALGSGLSRLTCHFWVVSRKYVLIILAMKGINVSSDCLKNAINTHTKKIGRAIAKATPLEVPPLYNVFQTPSVAHKPIAKIINWTTEIVAGPIVTLIFSHPQEIFLGIKIFIVTSLDKVYGQRNYRGNSQKLQKKT